MRFAGSVLKLFPALVAALAAAPLSAEEAGKASAGLPQLDASFFPGQIFWLAVVFTLLYILMARFALPGVERTLKKRQAAVAADLAAANAANEAARKLIAEYDKILTDARAQAVKTEDMTQVANESIEKQAEQQKILTQNTRQAEVRIASARDAAMREVQASAVEIANSVIEKITGMKMQVKA